MPLSEKAKEKREAEKAKYRMYQKFLKENDFILERLIRNVHKRGIITTTQQKEIDKYILEIINDENN